MFRASLLSSGAAPLVAMSLAATAMAGVDGEPIASIGYNDLTGNFTATGPSTGSFTAIATDTPGRQSSMNVSRLIPVQADAEFFRGFVSAANPANLVISINTNTLTLAGAGSFAATDIDGDTITGDITGDWVNISGLFMTFNGAVSNVQFSGSSFDGNLGSFSTIFPGGSVFDGAIVQLSSTTGIPGGGFSAIVNSPTGGTIQITPAPGAVALLGLGGLMATRRRR